jgi:threonine dehydratase
LISVAGNMPMASLPSHIPLSEIEAARARTAGVALRTPLIRLNIEDTPCEIYLKLENLQAIGSFKLRGAANALMVAAPEVLKGGVYTASAGNMAQGVAWNARRLGIGCDVVVPDHAPQAKLDAIERLGAHITKVPFDRWWAVLVEHRFAELSGHFIHPVSNRDVIAGNGVIGLEVLEDLPEVDAIVVPYGGGGLSAGIGSAVKASRPNVNVFGVEVATAAPLAASMAAGRPVSIDYRASFVDGIGGKSLLAEMWPLVSAVLAGSLVVSLEQVADAIRFLVQRNRVVAEGAGAASVAAAMLGMAGKGKVVCIVSGGNINASTLGRILLGEVPAATK